MRIAVLKSNSAGSVCSVITKRSDSTQQKRVRKFAYPPRRYVEHPCRTLLGHLREGLPIGRPSAMLGHSPDKLSPLFSRVAVALGFQVLKLST